MGADLGLEATLGRQDYRKPILFLFVLSPMIGELLSGSSPPLEFFNPFAFLLLAALYGSGALLVREYARRWGKGWYSIMFLGAAYGIVEEGIMVRSFFNPNWPDLNILGTYGRWLGVNWVWAEWLTIYHAIFSITIPILLVELMYPQARVQPWLTLKQRLLFQSLFVGVVLLGFIAFPYDAPALGLVGCVAAVFLLAWAAKGIPNMTLRQPGLRVSLRVLLPVGFSVPFSFFFLFYALPGAIPLPMLTMLIGVLGVLGYERLLRRWSLRGFNDLQRLGLAAGGLGFFILLAPVQELNGSFGMSIVGLGFFIFLFKLRKQLLSRTAGITPVSPFGPQLPTPKPTLR